MQFNRPTTLEELYSTLQDIFYYYRVKKADYEQEILQPLVLEKIEFVPKTDQELMQKAHDLIYCEQLIQLNNARLDLVKQKDSYLDKVNQLTKTYNQNVEKVIENYNQSVIKLQEEAIKRGVGMTSVVTAQLKDLEDKKNVQLSSLENEYGTQSQYYLEKIEETSARLENLDSEYQQIFESQKMQKFLMLKDEQEDLMREIFKYNNGIEEKQQRSINSIAQSNASLKLKYMEISAENFSKDQLIELGYYQDVIDCVCAYYDRFTPLDGWRNIANDAKVAIYLEEYYTQIVFMYQQRAGVI